MEAPIANKFPGNMYRSTNTVCVEKDLRGAGRARGDGNKINQ